MTGRLYQLEPRDITGVFLGLSATECVLVGGGLVGAITLRLAGASFTLAAVVVLAALGLAKVRVSARPVHAWIGLLARWVAVSLIGRRSWRAASSDPPAVAPVLATTELDETSEGIAVICDRSVATVTAVVPVMGGRFSGLEPAGQDALVDAWGEVLASHASAADPVVEFGWTQETAPSSLAGHRAWLAEAVGDIPADYAALTDEIASVTTRHRTVVWVTASGHRINGRGAPLQRAKTAIGPALDTLQGSLDRAGLHSDNPLGAEELRRLLARRADPAVTDPMAESVGLASRLGLTDDADAAGPLNVDIAWDHIQAGGTLHRTYWVESWPGRPIRPDWLAGLLNSDALTVTVAYWPLDPAKTQRRIDSQLVKLTAHRERKEDKGRRITETDLRTEQAALDLEAELASGHREVLYVGLVSVNANDPEKLAERCHSVEQDARAVGLGLRVLLGRQDAAWAATLPAGLLRPGAFELAGL